MKIGKLFLVCFAIYGFCVLFLHFFLDVLVFRPEKLREVYNFRFDSAFEEFDLVQEEGEPLNALLFHAPDTIKGIVLYFHGNADNLQRWGHYAVDFTRNDYDVLSIDYPGYGKSEGKPNEQAFYQAGETAYQWAIERYPVEQVIIYGRSLGCTTASYLGQKYPSKKLILETPFYSLGDLLGRRFAFLFPFGPKYQFPVNDFLKGSLSEAFIIQGTQDRIVPYESAIKLKPFLSDEDNFIVVDGGGHKNLRDFPIYQEKLASILE